MDMHDSIEPSSPVGKSKIAPDSDEDIQPRVELKNANREGTISKPRAKRGSLPEMQPSNRTPNFDKKKVGKKLSQSPSVAMQGNHGNSDDGGDDD